MGCRRPNPSSRPAGRPCPHRPSVATPSPPPRGCASAGRTRGCATIGRGGFSRAPSGVHLRQVPSLRRVGASMAANPPRPRHHRAQPHHPAKRQETPRRVLRRDVRAEAGPAAELRLRAQRPRRPRPAPGCRAGRAGWNGPGGRAPSRRQGARLARRGRLRWMSRTKSSSFGNDSLAQEDNAFGNRCQQKEHVFAVDNRRIWA